MADINLSLTIPSYTWPLLIGSAIIYLLTRRRLEKAQWISNPPPLKEKTAGIHLTGDQVVSPETLIYLENMRDQWQIPGVSIAIVRINKDGAWDKQTIGLGRKDAEGNQVTERVGQGFIPLFQISSNKIDCPILVCMQTLFSIASNSKLFTTIAAGLSLSQAKLSWHTLVKAVNPYFEMMDKEAEEQATFIDLMSHQTGLARHDISYK
jgi:CubicO group peptidase (beta-lactamase class C family)